MFFCNQISLRTCLEYYKLDPCHYFSSPGLAWEACLKMAGIKIDLITEKGLPGGISYISTCHSQANNKYMKDYYPSKEDTYIMYLDATYL